MKLRFVHIALFCGCLWLLASCVDKVEIDVPLQSLNRNIVVEGLIHDGAGPYHFRFFYTTLRDRNVFAAFDPTEAVVRDDQGNEETLQRQSAGIYQLAGNTIRGQAGRSYTLSFKDAEGHEYASDPESLRAVAQLDSVYFTVNYEEVYDPQGRLRTYNLVEAFVDVQFSSDEQAPYLRWDAERWYRFTEPAQPDNPLFFPKACYIREPANRDVLLFDGRTLGADRWRGQKVAQMESDWKFYERSALVVTQYSLTAAAYEYWQKVARVSQQNGDIFDSPPAAIRGNIHRLDNDYELVLGYFEVAGTDTIILWQNRQDMPNPLQPFCNQPNASYYFSGGNPCGECLSIPSSTINPPYFW